MVTKIVTVPKTGCYHCGDVCNDVGIRLSDKVFCCEGCKMVYQILNQGELCDYYQLNDSPGISQKIIIRKDKFAFLDDEEVQNRLISFKNEEQVHVQLYIPHIHCSSCIYLLENLHKLDGGVSSSRVDFAAKEISIIFSSLKTSLRKIAELMAAIGYEPWISLNNFDKKKPTVDKSMIYQLGVAGFCFGNIMLLSFPEYLGIDGSDALLRNVFRWLNLILALPVFLYAAWPFYASSWKSLKRGFVNIDAPIALAIIITFMRSAWIVLYTAGGGYFDSMTGIVFFMLAGRVLQDKTYRQLSFDRDYTSWFPIAVSVLKNGDETPTLLPNIKNGDTLLIHNEELVPADGILTRGHAYIDYSFVTGESLPVRKEMGELVYAGGRQTGSNIELLVVKEVAQSYLTALWEKDELKNKPATQMSFVHLLSRYFTWIVLGIALFTGIYWQQHDPSKTWNSVTSIFIIACPCALLLSNTFTNGSILRILARNYFYLRSAQTIEDIASIDHIVFDKTGTLTTAGIHDINYRGKPLTPLQQNQLYSLVSCSGHPLSKALAKKFYCSSRLPAEDFHEITGEGIEGMVLNQHLKIGNSSFVNNQDETSKGTVVYLNFDGELHGWFSFANVYRADVPALLKKLQKKFRLSVLSGDNDAGKQKLQALVDKHTDMLFNQKPEDKLAYIQYLQKQTEKVMMIGDGLNDAGAMKQSDVAIAIAEGGNNFTPACDAILKASEMPKLTKFISMCKANRRIVLTSFILSVAYNIIGLYFAVQGNLSPLIAAVLMPSSSLCIFLVTYGSSHLLARRMGL